MSTLQQACDCYQACDRYIIIPCQTESLVRIQADIGTGHGRVLRHLALAAAGAQLFGLSKLRSAPAAAGPAPISDAGLAAFRRWSCCVPAPEKAFGVQVP